MAAPAFGQAGSCAPHTGPGRRTGQASCRAEDSAACDAGRRRERGAPFVSVAIRVKPVPSAAEDNIAVWAKPPEDGSSRQRRVCCHRGYVLEEYEFSRVFGPEDNNYALFRDLQGPSLTDSVFSGVNETLFAYGQTGSGKTHTIFGSREEPGLLELFVQSFFQQAEACPGSTVHACCYEVYGDTLTDLVNPQRLLEHGDLQSEDIVCDELFIKTHLCRYQIVRVPRLETCLDLLHEARTNRTDGVSSCNSSSSRSHAVVHIFVQNPTGGQEASGGTRSSIGALTLVDLAGTEKEHENPSEQGKKSARLLNTSLSSLNRLLRKLQTGSLDESERRQSVLNKCLWEYLRPGCGIALVFCVSPLARHRAITLSTLAMATDSKLIHSHRKSQYIQIPTPAQSQQPVPRSHVQYTPSQSPRSARSSLPSPLARGHEGALSSGTPKRAASTGATWAGSYGRTPEFSASPRSSRGSSRRTDAQDSANGAPSAEELEALIGLDLRSPQAVRNLAMQNTKLRRRLQRTRTKSVERLERAEKDREQLSTDFAALQRECESLRALFIRQQQQQIAFWTGPFMDMIAPKDAVMTREEEQDPLAGGSPPRPVDSLHCPTVVWSPQHTWSSACPSRVEPEPAPLSARPRPPGAQPTQRSPALDSLRHERDYWRSVANDLKREMHGGPQICNADNSHKGARQASTKAGLVWDSGELSSTSQTVQESSGDPSRTAWSDTGSDMSCRSLAAEA